MYLAIVRCVILQEGWGVRTGNVFLVKFQIELKSVLGRQKGKDTIQNSTIFWVQVLCWRNSTQNLVEHGRELVHILSSKTSSQVSTDEWIAKIDKIHPTFYFMLFYPFIYAQPMLTSTYFQAEGGCCNDCRLCQLFLYVHICHVLMMMMLH